MAEYIYKKDLLVNSPVGLSFDTWEQWAEYINEFKTFEFEPNEEAMQAVKEDDRIKNGEVEAKRYSDTDILMSDLGDEERDE